MTAPEVAEFFSEATPMLELAHPSGQAVQRADLDGGTAGSRTARCRKRGTSAVGSQSSRRRSHLGHGGRSGNARDALGRFADST
jgi:hypothetical protein